MGRFARAGDVRSMIPLQAECRIFRKRVVRTAFPPASVRSMMCPRREFMDTIRSVHVERKWTQAKQASVATDRWS